MRSKGLWVVVLLAVVGVVGWLVLRPAADPTVVGDAGPDDDPTATAAPGGVGAATTLAGGRGRADGAGAAPRPVGEQKGRSSLVGTVRRKGAPVAAQVEVRLAMSSDPARAMRGGPAAFFARVVAPPIGLERPAAVAVAGADGRFTIDGLAAGAWWVRAVTADGARGTTQAELAVDGARAAADVDVFAGDEVLAGRVVRADGTPFSGLVTVDRAGAGRQGFGALLTSSGDVIDVDAQGRFRATGLEAGPYVVSAIEVGTFRAVGKPVLVPTTAEYVLTIGAATTLVEGRVLAEPDGTPIAGADVLAGGRGAGDVELAVARTTSDAAGKFTLPVGAGPDRAVVVTAVGFGPAMTQLGGGASSGPVEIRMSRAGKVGGRVTAEGDGHPVRGLRVSANSTGRGLPFGGATATTDADGRYTLDDVAPGEAMVTAEGDGWVTKGAGDATRGYNPLIVPVEPGKTATADLVVARGARLAGVVVGPDGAPSVGAVVRGEARGGDGGMMRFGGFGPGPAAATGPDGLFLLEGLAADTPYDVVATAVGAAEARVGPTVATTATPPPRVEIRLVAPRTVEVSVVDLDKETPVVGANVSAVIQTGGVGRGSGGALTDALGRARVEVPPGAVGSVHASHEDYLSSEPAKLVEGSDRVVVRLRRALTITGTVVDLDGTPAADVRVTSTSSGRWVRPASTDAQGKFRLTSLEAGTYDLEARVLKAERVGLVGTAKAAAGATDVVIKLARPEGQATGLVVRVVDGDGKPVPRADVQVEFANGSSGTRVENGLGVVDLSRREGALVGATVVVRNARSLGGQTLPFGPARLGPLTGNETEVEVRLPAEKAIVGVVRDPEGKPVRGVVVVAADARQASNIEWAFQTDGSDLPRARTDAEGRFRLGGLGDDEVQVFVQPPPDFPMPEPVTARGGRTDVVVTLSPGTAVAVTVLDDAGEPVVGATVNTSIVVERREGDDWVAPRSGPAARADASGVARLRGLEPQKRYALSVSGPGNGWLATQRDAWSPKDETVRLARAFQVAGVVRDLAGRPLAGVQVYRKTGEHGWSGSAGTDAEGRFQVDQLPAGEVVLRATVVGVTGGAPAAFGEVEVKVRAGAKDVVITLDPGLELVLRYAGDDARRVFVQVVAVGADGARGRTFHVRFDAGGVGRAQGLASTDRCVVWMPPDAEGRSFLARDVRPGAELVVAPRPGLSIKGRVTGPPGAKGFRVDAQLPVLFLSAQGTPDAAGAFEVKGLPEGTTWRLIASCEVNGRWLHAQGPEVAAGGTANVDIRDERR